MKLRRLSLLVLVLALGACGRVDEAIIAPGMGYDPGGMEHPATPRYASDDYVPTSYSY